jgi:hypothetical protein
MAKEYKGFASPSSISAIIFIIIGIIMAVIGIIILISETGNKSWYTWLLIIGGIIFSIVGSIMLTIERSKMKMEEKQYNLSHTPMVHQTPAHTHISQHPASSHIDMVDRSGTLMAQSNVSVMGDGVTVKRTIYPGTAHIGHKTTYEELNHM